MELSEKEIEKIAMACAQRVLEGLHRYPLHYNPPESIAQGLSDSMVEESAAAAWYRRRGMDARLKGDMRTAEVYEHAAGEEDRHYTEFRERLNALSILVGEE